MERASKPSTPPPRQACQCPEHGDEGCRADACIMLCRLIVRIERGIARKQSITLQLCLDCAVQEALQAGDLDMLLQLMERASSATKGDLETKDTD